MIWSRYWLKGVLICWNLGKKYFCLSTSKIKVSKKFLISFPVTVDSPRCCYGFYFSPDLDFVKCKAPSDFSAGRIAFGKDLLIEFFAVAYLLRLVP